MYGECLVFLTIRNMKKKQETDAQIPAHSNHHGHHQESQWQEVLVRMVVKRTSIHKRELPLDPVTPISGMPKKTE